MREGTGRTCPAGPRIRSCGACVRLPAIGFALVTPSRSSRGWSLRLRSTKISGRCRTIPLRKPAGTGFRDRRTLSPVRPACKQCSIPPLRRRGFASRRTTRGCGCRCTTTAPASLAGRRRWRRIRATLSTAPWGWTVPRRSTTYSRCRRDEEWCRPSRERSKFWSIARICRRLPIWRIWRCGRRPAPSVGSRWSWRLGGWTGSGRGS